MVNRPVEGEQIIKELSRFNHELYKVLDWQPDSTSPELDSREKVTGLADADVIISALKDDPSMHTIMLDLDVPATLVPSSTPGHSHLYIDVPMSWPSYKRLLTVLSQVGVIQPGYASVSAKRGFTSLRLPWVKKEEVTS